MTNKISYQSNSSRLTFGRLAQNQAKAMDETNSTTLNLIDFIVLLLPENNNKTLKPHIDIDRRNFNARQRFSGLSSFHKDISRTLLEIKMCLRQITIKNTIILSSNHTRALIFSKWGIKFHYKHARTSTVGIRIMGGENPQFRICSIFLSVNAKKCVYFSSNNKKKGL